MAENRKNQEEKRQDRLHPNNANQGGNRSSRNESQGDRQSGEEDMDSPGNRPPRFEKAAAPNKKRDQNRVPGKGRSGSASNAD
jgi:hypothetical protein